MEQSIASRLCQGATYSTLVAEFGISKTCVHNYIEDARALLREEIHDLAARERAVAVELLDNAIEKIVPHINGQIGMPHCVHVMQSIRRVKLATFLSVTATLAPPLVHPNAASIGSSLRFIKFLSVVCGQERGF